MNPDLSQKPLADLRQIVLNHRNLGQTHLALCRAASDEIARRGGGPLKFWTTFDALRAAAEQHRFVTYGDVAKENGLTWLQARYQVTKHLNEILDYAIDRDWPLLTAIVVDATGIASGKMSDVSLDGFVKSANDRHRFPGGDFRQFLAEQQTKVFEWADKERGRDLRT